MNQMSVEDLSSYHAQSSAEGITPTVYLTGPAGSGKTYQLKQRIEADPSFALLCATTGIAGVNLGASTIHSQLGYFNTSSLEDAYTEGWLHKRLKWIAEHYSWLAPDEVSMMPHRQLDLITMATNEINEDRHEKEKSLLGILVTGDFAQLPPIPGDKLDANGRPILQETGRWKGYPVKEKTPWAFDAENWDGYQNHTIKLSKIWRQDNPKFLEALNCIRCGAATAGTGILKSIVEFAPSALHGFDGTTIVSKNEEVDRVNNLHLMSLQGEKFTLTSSRWWSGQDQGRKQPSEWNAIPERTDIKVGALVMLLDNKREEGSKQLLYCNGDLAHIEEVDRVEDDILSMQLKLVRNGAVITLGATTRRIEARGEPDEAEQKANPKIYKSKTLLGKSCWVTGAVTFFPIRLAYATTVHKSQGLSLDRVQIDPRNHFFGNPQMAYVALSRCRTPEGLRIIGRPDELAKKIKIDPILRTRGFL